MLKRTKKKQFKIIYIVIILLFVSLFIYTKMNDKKEHIQVSKEIIENVDNNEQLLEGLVNDKRDEIINIDECSDEFMNNYFEDMSNINAEEEENILIVTSLNKIENDYGATKVINAPNNQYFLQYKTKEEKNEALKNLKKDTLILNAEENIIYTTCNKKYNSWGIEKTGLDKAIEVSESNQLNEITVAIIDTGCNVSLIENNYPGKIKGTYNVLTSATDVTDIAGHGTHVAGTIAEGTPSNVTILPIRASSENKPNEFTSVNIITAINYVVYNKKAQLINMSFGGERRSNSEYVAIESANSNNIICVAAAGNDSSSNAHYPSGFDNTISISSVDKDLNLSDFSNYGETITFCAPGTDILSVNGKKSGTSMATPHAVCAIAILKSYNPDYSMDEITDELKKYAIDLGQLGWDEKYGYGFINFNGAPFEELGEEKLFKENSEDYNIVKKIEPVSNYIAQNNYGTISNILEATINIYYTNTDYYTKALGELEDLELLNYEPYTYTIQNVIVKYNGQECILSVDNTNNTTSAWKYEIIDDEKGDISITKWNPKGNVNLKKLYIPSEIDGYTVKKIGQDVFNQNKIINYYYLPDSIDTIGKNAFSASSIIELNSKADAVRVEESAFRLCYSLRKFEPKLSYVGRSAFDNAMKLESITFTDSIEIISEYAFYICESLKNIQLPETATTIENAAFMACRNIESINIPKNVTSIGMYAFGNIDNIKSISIDSNNPIYDSRNNCNAIIETATNTLIQGYAITNIPSSVKIIGENSFNGTLFKEITIPEGVERIEDKAFYYSVYNLETVILPSSVTYINPNAFKYASLSKNPTFWVYRDSYAETFIKTTDFSYLYRNDNIYDIDVELAKTDYYALEEIDIDDISITVIYNNDNLTHESYLGDVYITYNNDDNNMRLNYGDEYVTIGILDGGRKVTKNVPINISKVLPTYEAPQNLTGKANTLLSSVLLPDNFEWMNPNQLITQTGNKIFKAKYIPVDYKNYKTVENIDINVFISEGKEIIVPNISIQDKEYDGTTTIDLNSIVISNLNDDEYTIQNIFLLSPKVGNKKASVRLKLTNEKFEEFTFDNGKSEKTFVENIKINKAIPTYDLPQNISANIGQDLSEIILPDGFEWMNKKTTIDEIGDIKYKAKYIPEDIENYEIIENIDIIVSVVNPREVIVPIITINDKIYDGMTTINDSNINISNLEMTEYNIISSTLSSANVGERIATIKLRLSDEKYEEYSFDNGKQEKEFEVDVNVLPLELIKPTLVEKEYVYNGTVQTIELNNFDADKMNISGNSRTNAGEQKVIISLKDENYSWNDGTRSNIDFTFKINKANSNIQYSASNMIYKYDGEFYGIELNLETPANVNIKYANENNEYILDEMPKYNEIGTYTIKYRIYINENYTDMYGENTLAIVENYVMGDINEDGKVNIKDWNMLYNHINETEQLTGYQLLCADINGDGKVNIKDWNRMYDHITEVNPLW